MTRNFDNRRRAFADVVSIDAWHDAFNSENSIVDLHADVVFGKARIGGEPESPVRFRLSVRRAEVVVVIPGTEPVRVDRKTVSRAVTQREGTVVESVERAAKANVKGNASASFGQSGISGSISGESGAQANISASKKIEISAAFEFMKITQSKTADDHYRWIIEPQQSGYLEGRPWDGAKEPRLKLIDKRTDRSKGIPPSVRVEVRCRREDLIVEDIEVKDETTWASLKRAAGFRNKLVAAESYIRDRLAEEGFEVKNVGEIFIELILGAVTPEAS
jgi:hypothetical protein